MNRVLRCVTVLAIAIGPTVASADTESELIALEKRSWVAWQARDGAWFADFLTDDHVEMTAMGPSPKQPVVDFVGSDQCVVRSYAVDQFKVTRFTDDVALVTYLATQDTTCYGQPVPSPSWTSSLFVKRDGRWRNALYQHSPAAKPAAKPAG